MTDPATCAHQETVNKGSASMRGDTSIPYGDLFQVREAVLHRGSWTSQGSLVSSRLTTVIGRHLCSNIPKNKTKGGSYGNQINGRCGGITIAM